MPRPPDDCDGVEDGVWRGGGDVGGDVEFAWGEGRGRDGSGWRGWVGQSFFLGFEVWEFGYGGFVGWLVWLADGRWFRTGFGRTDFHSERCCPWYGRV